MTERHIKIQYLTKVLLGQEAAANNRFADVFGTVGNQGALSSKFTRR
jgi:hypothetical protein